MKRFGPMGRTVPEPLFRYGAVHQLFDPELVYAQPYKSGNYVPCLVYYSEICLQLKFHSEKVQRLGEDRAQRSVMLDNTRNKHSDVIALSQQLRESLEELQCKVNHNRDIFAAQQIELDTERYKQKRTEEDLEVVKRKAAVLEAEKEGSIVGKLQEELKEYKEILKCRVCHDRPKEVVITKCYHLVCNPCIQRVVETRHRKCPVCGASFGTNDVKPVYI